MTTRTPRPPQRLRAGQYWLPGLVVAAPWAGIRLGWFRRGWLPAVGRPSAVRYLTADLTDRPAGWAGTFDLVMEAYTVQPLFGAARQEAMAALAGPVAPGGTLLVIARATDEDDPQRDPASMPWPLTRREIDLAGGPLRLIQLEKFLDQEDPPKLRWRAEFRRD